MLKASPGQTLGEENDYEEQQIYVGHVEALHKHTMQLYNSLHISSTVSYTNALQDMSKGSEVHFLHVVWCI